MPSALAWLDQSEEAQRRARELIRMFQETESRDELGIGQIRDIYSDWLFPGTSVIQTRARYFLIIPWLFKYHENKKRAGDELLKRVQADERLLIERLKSASSSGTGAKVDMDGLIGVQKGAAVKTLPSTIYWNGLRRLGILRVPSRPDGLGISSHPTEADPDAAEELATLQIGNWHPTLPPPPEGFPRELSGGLRVEEDLKLRIRELTGGIGADVVYDPVGGTYAEPALRATAWNGRYLVIGFASGEIPKIPLNLLLLKGCQAVGVFWGAFVAREPQRHRSNIKQLVEWWRKGKLRPHVSETFPLEQAADAIRLLADRKALGKVVVTIGN